MKRALVALALLLAACKGDTATPTRSSTTTATGKPVRIGVWMPADPDANTYGGAAVRELTLPQLFTATPEGKWTPSLVAPGTDMTGPGATSARFRLRRGARWSDGTPITVVDLRRTLDPRFVKSIDDPTPTRTIVVHFTQKLPGWRRLWSGLDAIRAPRPGVFGGPYTVANITPGLETVLAANRHYFGVVPAITEVRLVLVPDPEIAARLMERGELDVIAPPAYTERTARLDRINDVHVVVGDAQRGGWTAALVTNPSRLDLDQRAFLFGYADAPRFTDVLLHGEATRSARAAHPPVAQPSFSATPAFTAPNESGPSGVLLHAMQRRAHKAGFDFDLRQAQFDDVLGTYAAGDFDVLFRLQPSTPTVCWTCSYATVDAALAHNADTGDRRAVTALRRKLLVENDELPLWRERPVVAVRDGLDGVRPNGFDVLGPAWNVAEWRWTQ